MKKLGPSVMRQMMDRKDRARMQKEKSHFQVIPNWSLTIGTSLKCLWQWGKTQGTVRAAPPESAL
jgi:hypothetical protein